MTIILIVFAIFLIGVKYNITFKNEHDGVYVIWKEKTKDLISGCYRDTYYSRKIINHKNK